MEPSLTEGHEIILVRNYAPESDRAGEVPSNVRRMNQQADAVLRVISTLDDALSMEMVNDINWVVNFQDQPVCLVEDIYFQIIEIQRSNKSDKSISLLRFKLFSDVLSAKDLVNHVTRLYRDYNQSLTHDLLGHQFYFDQKYRNNEKLDAQTSPFEGANPRLARKYELNQAPKHLSFVQYPFKSNKTFDSLFGDEIDKIQARVERFVDNKAWYDSKGIPWQLGIMLSGKNGSGKTSCISALANLTNRHVVNVNAKDIMTHTQLKRLFLEEDLHVYDDEDLTNINRLNIPVSQRIYVIDEIDTMGSILHDRDTGNKGFDDSEGEPLYDEITLGHWLSLLDGTNQADGRILIATSNYPERLAKALLRPGRIDLNITLGNASRKTIKQMYLHFFDEEFPEERTMQLPDNYLSPAEVSNIMQMCIDDPASFWCELRTFVVQKRKADQAAGRGLEGASLGIDETIQSCPLNPIAPIANTQHRNNNDYELRRLNPISNSSVAPTIPQGQNKGRNPFVGVNTFNSMFGGTASAPASAFGDGDSTFASALSNYSSMQNDVQR